MITRNKLTVEKEEFDNHGLDIGQIVYYARILPQVDVYELLELKLRTIAPDYFCGTDKTTKQAYSFSYKALDKTVFGQRNKALTAIKEAEKTRKKIVFHKFEEEED